MEVVIVASREAGAALVADTVGALLASKPAATLGLATGSTPLPVYEALAARPLSWEQVSGFALDEYVGLPPGHRESYRQVLLREFAGRVGLDPSRLHTPDGWAEDLPAACRDYEAAIVGAGGIDLQILGVGTDGHIGFNEPSSSLASLTRIKTLTGQTRRDNARFFGGDPEQVPRHVLTQGVGTILRARHLVLLAWGSGKARAVANTVEGPVTAMVPSSALQLHPHATIVADESAASELRLGDYYREVFEGKPAWQGL